MLMAPCSAIVGAIFPKNRKIENCPPNLEKLGNVTKSGIRISRVDCWLFFFKVKERREDLVAADVVGR